MEVERWRILDFYLLFPSLLAEFSFPEEFKALRKLIPPEGKFRRVNDPKRLFFRMEPIQTAAINFLASHEVISSKDLLDNRRIKWIEEKCPPLLKSALDQHESDAIIELLVGPFLTIDLYGKSGLKARSDLFQYRYDVPRIKTN